MDEFEQFLKKQPLRDVPPTWRREILSATSKPEAIQPWWREWLWPSPVAWAGLACVWLIIFALNFAARPTTGEREMASRTLRSPEEVAVALAEQQKELARLLAQPSEPAVEPRRVNSPGPRSDICVVTVEA